MQEAAGDDPVPLAIGDRRAAQREVVDRPDPDASRARPSRRRSRRGRRARSPRSACRWPAPRTERPNERVPVVTLVRWRAHSGHPHPHRGGGHAVRADRPPAVRAGDAGLAVGVAVAGLHRARRLTAGAPALGRRSVERDADQRRRGRLLAAATRLDRHQHGAGSVKSMDPDRPAHQPIVADYVEHGWSRPGFHDLPTTPRLHRPCRTTVRQVLGNPGPCDRDAAPEPPEIRNLDEPPAGSNSIPGRVRTTPVGCRP